MIMKNNDNFLGLIGIILAILMTVLGIAIEKSVIFAPVDVHYAFGFFMGIITTLTLAIFNWPSDKDN